MDTATDAATIAARTTTTAADPLANMPASTFSAATPTATMTTSSENLAAQPSNDNPCVSQVAFAT